MMPTAGSSELMRRRISSDINRPLDLTDQNAEEAPFLRPQTRTRVRRARRGGLSRTVLAIEAVGALVVLSALLWGGYSKVMASERLKVAQLEITGTQSLSPDQVRALLGPAVGQNILTLDLEELKSRLRASPWVADATVRRAIPHVLQIEIRERVPLALADVDRLQLMDADGVLIDTQATSGFDLPIVRGLREISEAERRSRAQHAGALLADLGDLAAEVSEVIVVSPTELRLVLRGGGETVLMGAAPHRERLQMFLSARKELLSRCPDAEYFDLRFRDRIFAKRRTPSPESVHAVEGR